MYSSNTRARKTKAHFAGCAVEICPSRKLGYLLHSWHTFCTGPRTPRMFELRFSCQRQAIVCRSLSLRTQFVAETVCGVHEYGSGLQGMPALLKAVSPPPGDLKGSGFAFVPKSRGQASASLSRTAAEETAEGPSKELRASAPEPFRPKGPQVSSSMLANRRAGESSAAMTFSMIVQIMPRSILKLEDTRKATVS